MDLSGRCRAGGLLRDFIGAPVAWAAVLLELPTVIAAVLTVVVTCFVVVFRQSGFGPAFSSTVIVSVTQWLVAWVVYGKSANHRALATALRLSEDKFSMAFEGNADAIFVSEIASGRFLEVNIGFARLTGRTRQEAILR